MTASACLKCGGAFLPGVSPGGLCPACLLATALSSDPDDPGTGISEDAAYALAPGTMVGPFQVVGVLGRGGMATVYEAYDGRLERAVALKVLPPEFLHDGTFAKRFENEARVIAKLEHPNIVPIYASGIDEGIPWMSMRLLTGGNLGALLGNRCPPSCHFVQMLRDIANALDYAHARGVVHRDIKPANILRDDAGRLCVGDFGLAQMLEGGAGPTRTGTIVGTPQYMAPEQALGHAADHRGDIYSLGIVAYEMFVGDVPFAGDSPVAVLMKHVNEPVPTPRDEVLPPLLMRAIQKALAKDPGDRWPSAGAFVAALETAIGVTSGDPTPSAKVNRPVRSRMRWLGAASGALVAAAGWVWFVAQESPRPSPLPASERVIDASLPAVFAAAPPEDAAQTIAVGETVPNREPSLLARVEPQAPQGIPAQANKVPPPWELPANIGLLRMPLWQPRTPTDVPAPASAVEASSVGDVAPQTAVADTITPPLRIRTVSPEYPSVARAAELEGDVLLQATVGLDGKVSDVKVLQAVHAVLGEAAKKAVQQYEYTPGRRNGIPESAVVRITVSFKLR